MRAAIGEGWHAVAACCGERWLACVSAGACASFLLVWQRLTLQLL